MTETNSWRVIAIIFMLISALLFGILVWLSSIGNEIIENEFECSYNLCPNLESDAYLYDEVNKVCYCYLDQEIVHTEYMGQ